MLKNSCSKKKKECVQYKAAYGANNLTSFGRNNVALLSRKPAKTIGREIGDYLNLQYTCSNYLAPTTRVQTSLQLTILSVSPTDNYSRWRQGCARASVLTVNMAWHCDMLGSTSPFSGKSKLRRHTCKEIQRRHFASSAAVPQSATHALL